MMKFKISSQIRKGSSLPEYGILTGVIGLFALSAVYLAGRQIESSFASAQNRIEVAQRHPSASGQLGYAPNSLVMIIEGDSPYFYFEPAAGKSITVHWDEENSQTISSANGYGYTYDIFDHHTIVIEGHLNTFKDWGREVREIVDFGQVGLTTLESTFGTTNALRKLSPLPPTVTSLRSTFYDVNPSFTGLADWDVSRVTNMETTFYGTDSFSEDLSGWDVSSATNMDGMFQINSNMTADLSGWCVTNIPSAPTNFGATGAIHPVWGTCPSP